MLTLWGPLWWALLVHIQQGLCAWALRPGRFWGEEVRSAEIGLHGSFAATYWGHRTDVAILAGLLGMAMDDSRIPAAKELAAQAGLRYAFQVVDLGDVHPTSVLMRVQGDSRAVEVKGASIGGGRISIYEIDRFPVSIDGTYSVLLARYTDQPGIVADITRILASFGINIAFMDVSRKMRGSEVPLGCRNGRSHRQ